MGNIWVCMGIHMYITDPFTLLEDPHKRREGVGVPLSGTLLELGQGGRPPPLNTPLTSPPVVWDERRPAKYGLRLYSPYP